MRLFLVAAIASAQTMTPLTNPAPAGSIEPNWSVTADGSAVLTWIEPSTGSLKYAVRKGAAWSTAQTVATQRKFFRHPAELPEVMPSGSGKWIAHWVEMPDPKSEAEYAYVSTSADGAHWSAPARAHKDNAPVQHGLVSMLPDGNGGASLFFLESLKGEDGPTFLMRSVVDAYGKIVNEERLDEDVCSCCPTAVAKTSKGILLAYRGHTPKDIRDISIIRFENGKWTPAKTINADNWQINACPINAAAVAAKGDKVVVAWFTAAQNNPRVLAAISSDSGATFAKPITVSTAKAHGYASVAIDETGAAMVSWVEQSGSTARVAVRMIGGAVVEIAKGDRAVLGYPKIVRAGKETLIAWGGAKVQTAVLH